MKIAAKDCPLISVQVYNDRAEVTRSIPVTSLTPGCTAKLTVQDLVDSIDPQTVRVKGNKFVQILEVTQDRVLRDNNSSLSNNEVQKLQEKRQKLCEKLLSLDKQFLMLEQYSTLNQQFATNSFSRVQNCPPKSLDEAKEIMTWYASETQRLSDEKAVIEKGKNDTNLEINNLDVEIAKLNGTIYAKAEYMRTLNVFLDCQTFTATSESPELPPLVLTYTVSKASWTPSYDIRINSDKNSMQLVYFAEVRQASGEDWTDVTMLLSTANPSAGSTPTPLQNAIVREKVHVYHQEFSKSGAPKMMKLMRSSNAPPAPPAPMMAAMSQARGGLQLQADFSEGGMEAEIEEADSNMFAAEAGVKSSSAGYATGFEIPRKCTIETDNMSHKVIIADLTFTPEIIHYCSPSTTDINVYLQSKTKNSSTYELLSSAKVSVFLDGAFVSVSSIKHTSPASFFYLYLGVDASVQCSYNPIIVQDTKSWGMVTTSKCKNYSYVTNITNSKRKKIKVMLADVLPKSSSEKIVVELQDPKPSSVTKNVSTFVPNAGMASLDTTNLAKDNGVFQDDLGHVLVWLCTLEPKEKKTVPFKYQVTYPENMNIEVTKN